MVIFFTITLFKSYNMLELCLESASSKPQIPHKQPRHLDIVLLPQLTN